MALPFFFLKSGKAVLRTGNTIDDINSVVVRNSSFKTLKGSNISLNDIIVTQKSTTTSFLHFWATWCAPCITELPLIYKFCKSSNINLLLIAVNDDVEAAKRFLERNGIPLNILYFDDSDAHRSHYGVFKLPETIHFENDSLKILKVYTGAQSWQIP